MPEEATHHEIDFSSSDWGRNGFLILARKRKFPSHN
ncbi:Hypothetical protein, conserved [Brucella abortus str. 2308 A]|uniref:Uncharacterized protein n=7 Tax=Brucella TaxID=234 RepID=Q57F21_BRUAB|nr:hypothetical protein BR0338 [Brucella suis 1330]AAX73763.1 hypothetical protein BruAb1_0364 [Brucella abortus bv. 1 str. 9-941]ABQ61421.1 hypothetical protein BOV_0354 [Brucella ovis ATCC 25840]ABY37460.1 Hypothetical protein, conserved [Brucella suis ATCC 23445]ACD71877.1 hypothetical protein BAbS19_I03360 [Brucella abortus S19]ACU47353.1 hypothetical protein BMI_I343 [Brucella microti CCM 4915]ADZ86309.1 conserved hypothetical protein [Brucella melitensis M5-90]AEK53679.1 hypothetical p